MDANLYGGGGGRQWQWWCNVVSKMQQNFFEKQHQILRTISDLNKSGMREGNGGCCSWWQLRYMIDPKEMRSGGDLSFKSNGREWWRNRSEWI